MNVDPRYSSDPNGFRAYKARKDQKFAASTATKWLPIIDGFEKHRSKLGIPIKKVTAETLDMLLLPAMERAYVERYGREPSASTWRGWYDALRSYFRYLHSTGRLTVNPMLALTKPEYQVEEIECLTPAEDERLALCAKNPLEEVVVGLAREAGLRADEIAGLDDSDVDLEGGRIHVRRGKTKASVRAIPIVLTLYPKLVRYRTFKAESGIDSARFVATGWRGRISTGYVWVIVKQVAGRAEIRLHRDKNGNPVALGKSGKNVSEVSPHMLRRTFAVDLINRGVPLAIISDLLGHANQAITEKAYARYLKEIRAREAILAADQGPYSASRAVAGFEAKVIELPTRPSENASDLVDRIDVLMETLTSMRSVVALLSGSPNSLPALVAATA